MANRKKVEEFVYKLLHDLTGNDENTKLYKAYFDGMSDKAFDEFIERTKAGTETLSITVPNFSGMNVSIENNIKVAEKLGIKLFHKLWIDENDGVPRHQTPVEFMVLQLPTRRQSQRWSKKIRLSDAKNNIDKFTGQKTKKSAPASVSLVELQLLVSMGLLKSSTELMKYRGGDKQGRNFMKEMISKIGSTDMSTLENYAGRPEVTHTVNSFLTAMHIRTNI